MPGSSSHVSPKLTINKKKTIVHFSCQERKKKEKHKQSIIGCNPTMMSTRTAPCEREHSCASIYTTDYQILPLENISCASLMARVPPTRWDVGTLV
jgi:peptide deformylase